MLAEQLGQERALERAEVERPAAHRSEVCRSSPWMKRIGSTRTRPPMRERLGHQRAFRYFSASSCCRDFPRSWDSPRCVSADGLPPNSTARRATRATAWDQLEGRVQDRPARAGDDEVALLEFCRARSAMPTATAN